MSGRPGEWNRTVPFWTLVRSWLATRRWRTYRHIESLIVHLMEVEYRPRGVGRQQAFNDSKPILCVRPILNRPPQICKGGQMNTRGGSPVGLARQGMGTQDGSHGTSLTLAKTTPRHLAGLKVVDSERLGVCFDCWIHCSDLFCSLSFALRCFLHELNEMPPSQRRSTAISRFLMSVSRSSTYFDLVKPGPITVQLLLLGVCVAACRCLAL